MQTVESENQPDPLDTYEEYFQSVKEQLPEPFSQLHNEIYLHDGNLKEILYPSHESKLQLKIDTDDGKGNLRQIELNYIGVILFHSKADQENGLHGPLGYGDLGYDEVELLNNCIEHRILFSSGIELIIQFSDLKLKYIDHV